MKADIFLKDGDKETFLASVANLEVVPRGIYVFDGEMYQYTGQPTFIIEKVPYLHSVNSTHSLTKVILVVEKVHGANAR